MLSRKILLVALLICTFAGFSQDKKQRLPSTFTGVSKPMKPVNALRSKKNLIPASEKPQGGAPRLRIKNKTIPGKGLPKGMDPLLLKQKSFKGTKALAAPILTFEADAREASPSDPTGAVGPNHYVSARNSAFSIHDKSGNVLQQSISLENIFEGENDGDPIVFYDNFADRFVITQFFGAFSQGAGPFGFLIAVCQGSNPVTDGWYTYRYEVDSFPDYPKFSVWSDGYYITANKNQNSPSVNEVVFVLERDKMLVGEDTAGIQGFALPGALTNGFYSPLAFNAIGTVLPPRGLGHIVYYQDDSWDGVSEDKIKLWSLGVDWDTPSNSFIAEDQELSVSGGDISAFDATFSSGSTLNLPQPGGGGEDKDALQGAIMQVLNYRRFCGYNSVVFNFAVDIDNRVNSSGNELDHVSGIRWYELRQDGDNAPWYVNQEGTYAAPGGKSAWCASMAMDIYGNIGMGYSSVGTVQDGADRDSFISLHYTGRLVDDPPGMMTFAEQTIKNGTGVSQGKERYGDYSHLTVDPIDQNTFWFISEYPEATGTNMRDYVGVFKVATAIGNDIGVIAIDGPVTSTFESTESVKVRIKNFGEVAASNFPVQYSINGGPVVTEIFSGTISPGNEANFTFAKQEDFSAEREFMIEVQTDLASDATPINDCTSAVIFNLPADDVGVAAIINPKTGTGLAIDEPVMVNIKNYGGKAQSGFEVYYVVDNGTRITERYNDVLEGQSSQFFTFSQTFDFSDFRTYIVESGTILSNDQNLNNDLVIEEVLHEQCNPTSNCSQSQDGIISFELSNVVNRDIPCNDGYERFPNLIIDIAKTEEYVLTIQTGFVSEESQRFSIWIDYDDNTVYEEDELVLSNQVIKSNFEDQKYKFEVSADAPVGQHRMRIRGADTQNSGGVTKLNDPCAEITFGTTHDYFVKISERVEDSDIVVVSGDNDQFTFTMSDFNADESLPINIYDLSGQIIHSNVITKNSGIFEYDLDMSYVQSAIYFVQIGSNTTGRTAKFIVP
ncbi:T9SS type A sorting domain-containing protein [Aquimarina sp. ERC-38]|uniref:GEVED domain-containing protein n=1 Tax=Aquimarina sp. ERC-38 TaxID=2949996 RepID=UPI0022480BEA|nr:GEVED domain-containing protein [Aquimarina sp. ERC-38]UZO82149.1 T9SS type A sorting domain-containing protein [Aquimarina sp. ERC-38]